MKFNQLKLLVAIHRLRPKGDPITDQARMRRAIEVRDAYTAMCGEVRFPWTISDVLKMCVMYRKGKTTKIKAQIADAHGYECFWRDRGKGPCSDEVEGGHVIASKTGAKLSVANGMIECRAHNNQRRARTIEEYLDSGDTTS